MLDIQKCPLSRQEQEWERLIVEGRIICPRGNAHGFNAINEFSKSKSSIFQVHITEDAGG